MTALDVLAAELDEIREMGIDLLDDGYLDVLEESAAALRGEWNDSDTDGLLTVEPYEPGVTLENDRRVDGLSGTYGVDSSFISANGTVADDVSIGVDTLDVGDREVALGLSYRRDEEDAYVGVGARLDADRARIVAAKLLELADVVEKAEVRA